MHYIPLATSTHHLKFVAETDSQPTLNVWHLLGKQSCRRISFSHMTTRFASAPSNDPNAVKEAYAMDSCINQIRREAYRAQPFYPSYRERKMSLQSVARLSNIGAPLNLPSLHISRDEEPHSPEYDCFGQASDCGFYMVPGQARRASTAQCLLVISNSESSSVHQGSTWKVSRARYTYSSSTRRPRRD